MPMVITLGVSACLLGHPVRYDGAHKRASELLHAFGAETVWRPVCPEFECGLGAPREKMRLEGDPDAPRLVTLESRQDLTERMNRFIADRIETLKRDDLDGFIFKSKSPSCAPGELPIYIADGVEQDKKGQGVFARAFITHFSLLPVDDELRLNDGARRELFKTRILVSKDWREVTSRKQSRKLLLEFHELHREELLRLNPLSVGRMERELLAASGLSLEDLYSNYQSVVMEFWRWK